MFYGSRSSSTFWPGQRVDIFKSGDIGSESADNLVAIESKIVDNSDAKDVISPQAEEVS